MADVDETSIPFRALGRAGPPRLVHDGSLLLAGVVEIRGKAPSRARLAVIGAYSAVALGAFVAAVVAPGSTVVSDGWPGCARLEEVEHSRRLVGNALAHAVPPWVHRVFANAKRWTRRVCHGARPKHLQAYLDEFVFRLNRRHAPSAVSDRPLSLSPGLEPAIYRMWVGRS